MNLDYMREPTVALLRDLGITEYSDEGDVEKEVLRVFLKGAEIETMKLIGDLRVSVYGNDYEVRPEGVFVYLRNCPLQASVPCLVHLAVRFLTNARRMVVTSVETKVLLARVFGKDGEAPCVSVRAALSYAARALFIEEPEKVVAASSPAPLPEPEEE